MDRSERSVVTVAASISLSIGVRTVSLIAPSYPDQSVRPIRERPDQLILLADEKARPPSQAHRGQSSRLRTSYVPFDRARDQRATRSVCLGLRLARLGVGPERSKFHRVAG